MNHWSLKELTRESLAWLLLSVGAYIIELGIRLGEHGTRIHKELSEKHP